MLISFCDTHKRWVEWKHGPRVRVYLLNNQPVLGHWTQCKLCSAPAVCKIEAKPEVFV